MESAATGDAMPRLVIAGLSGGSGKTLASLALLLEARRREIPVRAFKKGPDYIDAAWLRWASGQPARNLDSYLMGFDAAAGSFARNGISAGLNVIEGNRGLYDGLDARGTHSTAALAKAIRAPVVLVIDATKVTRTAAALVLGCQKLDPELFIAGVILNRIAGTRHEALLRDAIESDCGVPVLGAIPRVPEGALVGMRHLGLVTPLEYAERGSLARNLIDRVVPRLDFDRLMEVARGAPPISAPAAPPLFASSASRVTAGYLTDSAFSFYYPENLEALQAAGAELAAISALTAAALPDNLDALYIGGGFPETHAEALARNAGFLSSVRQAAASGLPIYAECGGLMLLSRAIRWQGRKHSMAGVLPFEVEVCETPQGHGYAELLVDAANPFFPVGTRLRGHEFHYSRIAPDAAAPTTACAVLRGSGCFTGRDAVLERNVWAAYTHLHALASPAWAEGMLAAAHAARACA
ncbi:MAG TPA: cobyrinate a,c-diamide synthase [Candidatus Sulfopaludibacter sp.]|nr:cobyrinate a,c-diamide synthase [Candidatus Sulfopaludibacter sp.]